MIQVARLGSGFTVLVCSVANGHYPSRQAAIAAALKLKEAL